MSMPRKRERVSDHAACIFCPEAATEPALEEDGYAARRCSSCGLVFLWPRPSAAEVEALYRDDAAHLPATMFLASHGSPIARAQARAALALMRRHVRSGRLLEIGPGSGTLLAEARRRGFEPFALEASPIQADFIRERLGIPCAGSFEELEGLDPPPFDIVFHRDVLSHFHDPVDEFARINRRLADGGHHVFETGNLGDVDPRYYGAYRTFQFPDHVWFHSERSLRELLARTGFEHVRTYRYSILPELWTARQLRRLRRGAPAPGSSEGNGAGGGRGRGRRALHQGLDLFLHGLRHTVGAVGPKAGRPQTLVVVARKARAV